MRKEQREIIGVIWSVLNKVELLAWGTLVEVGAAEAFGLSDLQAGSDGVRVRVYTGAAQSVCYCASLQPVLSAGRLRQTPY